VKATYLKEVEILDDKQADDKWRLLMPDEVELLKLLYDRFNARDMETVLASLHEDVIWANGMEGGHVHGRDGVRSYWTRQWAKVDPRVEPVGFSTSSEGEKVIVEVHQIVRDRQGNVIVDQMVGHIFQIENGLVKRFDIRGE
jgi:nuclear transport factor 2 (NTF2) superfamily protein